jgi:hypothetical protein
MARPPSIGGLVDVGVDILSTTVSTKTKKILCQTGQVDAESTDADGCEWMQHVGFASRPPKPEAGKSAAQGLVFKTSDRDVCVASQDLRGLELYSGLSDGETCVYAAGADGTAQGRVLIKADSSVHLYTKEGGTSDGAGMTIQLDAANSAIRIIGPIGQAIILDADGITLTTGAASLKLGADGSVSLVGTGACQIDGTSICLGSIAAPVVNGVCVGPAGLVAISSTKVLAALA